MENRKTAEDGEERGRSEAEAGKKIVPPLPPPSLPSPPLSLLRPRFSSAIVRPRLPFLPFPSLPFILRKTVKHRFWEEIW